MRNLFCASLLTGLALAIPLRAADDADAKALLDKALQAVGGETKLAKLPATTFTAKGKFDDGNMQVDFSFTGSLQGPNQGQLNLDASVNGQNIQLKLVINKDKGWLAAGGQTNDAPAEALALLVPHIRSLQAMRALVSLKEKGVTLSSLGELKIDDTVALGIKVVQKDQPDLSIYFDKKTSLPLKYEIQVKESGGGQEVTHEMFFKDHKETDGIKHPSKVVLKRDGKQIIEVELSEIKSLDKVDASTFEKP